MEIDNSLTPKNQPEKPKSPLIEITLEDFLELTCHRTFDSYAVITRQRANQILAIDPLEEWSHIEEYGNDNLVKLYPIKIWKESPEKLLKDRSNSEQGRQERFETQQKQSLKVAQIQRKRDIIAEVSVDVRKRFPTWLSICKGLSTWQQQIEYLEYFIFRALNGENETIRIKFGIEKEICEEFQKLPADEGWRNKYYQADKELGL